MFYLDACTELTEFLHPYADELYYEFEKLPVVPGATYLIGREQLRLNGHRVRNMCEQCQIIFANPAEGSETLLWHLRKYGIEDLVLDSRVQLIGGGRMPPEYNCMLFEHFLTQPFRYEENKEACKRTPEIFSKTAKPYSFLCLNGRGRPHRCAILNQLEQLGLLDGALWTNLDDHLRPIRLLPSYYEVDRYHGTTVESGYVKAQLFNNEWGEIYIKPEPYIDTYFSVITETVYNYPWSLFSEKMCKPLAIGHPFVAVANYGFYRDLRDLGFQTFHSLIDETFDKLDNNQDRMDRVINSIKDLCSQDLAAFIQAAEPICKYNQQHLQEFAQRHMDQLPARFFQFINSST